MKYHTNCRFSSGGDREPTEGSPPERLRPSQVFPSQRFALDVTQPPPLRLFRNKAFPDTNATQELANIVYSLREGRRNEMKATAALVILAVAVAGAAAKTTYGYASSWNTYEEVEITSWVDDIVGATVSAFVLAPILFILGIVLLVWNEKRAIRLSLSLKELLGAVFVARGAHHFSLSLQSCI